jgi:hypothetical protein
MSVLSGRVYLLPIALGTCGIRFDFAGITGWKVEASSNTWVATVNKKSLTVSIHSQVDAQAFTVK